MPDLSASIADLRASGHKVIVNFSTFVGAEVMQATVDSAPTLPASNLTITNVSGSHTNVTAGMRVDIETSGGDFKGRTRVRFAGTISAVNLPIRETSDGSIDIQATDVVKVYSEYRLSDKLVEASGDFDPDQITYVAQGSNPPPVATSGGPWFGEVDDGGTFATITMAGSASYTVDPDSASGVTHLWTLPTGVAFAAGSVSTDANPTIEADAGTHIITHAVTDTDNSQVMTQYVPVRVHDSSDPPLDCTAEALDAELSGGWSATVRLFASATLASIPDGALCALWVRETINGTVQSFGNAVAGHSHIVMVGYMRRDDDDLDAEEEQLTFEIISPLSRLDELLGLSKVMLREASPDAWNELKTLTIKRAIIQIVQFYSTLIESGYDLIFHSTFTDKNFPAFYLQKQSPAAQIRELTDSLDNRLICDRAGRFEVQLRLELLALASRAAETTVLTLSTDDIIDLRFSREHWRQLELYRARGFIAGTTVAATPPVFSKWPGDAPGEGNQQVVQERLIVDSITDMYQRTGRRGANEDRVFVDSSGVLLVAPEMDVTLFGSYDVFDLYAEWLATSLTASDNLRGIDLSAFRWLIERIGVTYQGGTARVTLGLKAETHGEPGVDDTPPSDGLAGFPDFSLGDFPDLSFDLDPFDQFNLGPGTVSLGGFNSDGNLYRCGPDLTGRGFDTPSPLWEAVDLTGLSPDALGGTLKAFAVDPFSYQTASIDGWIATDTGIYSIDDIGAASPTLTLRHTFANSVADCVIETSIAQKNWVLAIYYNQGTTNPGFYAVRSTDGTTFTEAQITAHRRTTASFAQPPIYMSINTAGVAYSQAYTATSGQPPTDYYKTTDHGATWSLVSAASLNFDTTNAELLALLHFPWHNNASESIVYQAHVEISGSDEVNTLYRINGTTRTDVTPATGGNNYVPRQSRTASTSNKDRSKVALAATAVLAGPTDSRKQFVSGDSGASWTLINENEDYIGVHITDNHRIGYWWGDNGAIGYMSDFATIEDKMGNIPDDFPSIGAFENILGL
jgi:hypothetical protein